MHDERVPTWMLELHREINALIGIAHARDRENRHHLLGPEQGMIVVHLADAETNAVVAADPRLLQDDARALADERTINLRFLSRTVGLLEHDLFNRRHLLLR